MRDLGIEARILVREADVFLDLSDYQAVGRTAAEVTACGCLPLAPRLRGSTDFVEDGVSGVVAALEAAASFTPIRAAISELRALGLG